MKHFLINLTYNILLVKYQKEIDGTIKLGKFEFNKGTIYKAVGKPQKIVQG